MKTLDELKALCESWQGASDNRAPFIVELLTQLIIAQTALEQALKKERRRCLLILREPLSYNEMREAIINGEEGDYQINLDTHPPDPEELHIIDRLTMLVETMREEPAYELESDDYYKATLFWADQIEKILVHNE